MKKTLTELFCAFSTSHCLFYAFGKVIQLFGKCAQVMTIFTKCRQVTNYFTVSFSSEQIGKHDDNDKVKNRLSTLWIRGFV